MISIGKPAARMLAVALCAMAVCGCAPLRLPAIDPTGQRIFLPPPYSTTLVAPATPALPPPPQPAFEAPPQPPPCPFPQVAPPAITTTQFDACSKKLGCGPGHKHCGSKHHHGWADHFHPERRGRIVLLPKTVVAPVGGEVVLVSGLWGSNGHLVKHEELRWILSQGSVGHFVEVGGRGRALLAGLHGKPTEVVSGSFANSRTTAKPRLLTRGTPSPADDVALLAGQGWITVTSPSEGVSHVSVMAPDAEIWDQRRETATIYWIDARWELPPPVTLRAGEAHVLQTRVARNSAGAPAENWIVRYEIAEGSSAVLLPSGGNVAETVVNASGVASVQIQSQGGGSETAQVRVQIIRPAELGDGLPRLTVGQGWTSVTWTAPGLVLQAAGPATARPGDTLTYQVLVSNPGNMVTRGVVVKDEAPAGLVVLGSDPPFEQFGQMLQWTLGDLAPGQTRQITIQGRLEMDRTVRYGFRAESADGLAARDEVETVVERPALALEMRGPDRAQVGDRVTYEVTVRNTSGRDLSEVVVTDTYDPGLEQTEGAPSPIRRRLGPLAADQQRSFAVSFFVRQPGTLCHTLEATAPDGFTVRSRACLEATAPQQVPQPALDVEMSGPAEAQVGRFALYEARITNTGNLPLNGLQIAMSYDASLTARQASGGYRVQDGQFVWTIDRLDPGRSQIRQLNCLCVAPAEAAECRVEVTAVVEQLADRDAVRTRILPAAAPAPSPYVDPGANAPAPNIPPDEARPAAPGSLQISIADSPDPLAVGGTTAYLVTLSNERDQIDENIRLTIRIPEGMELVGAQGPVGVQASGDGGRTLDMTPISTLRARERLRPFRIEVRARQAGEFTFTAEATSTLSPQPVRQTETTTVAGP